MTRWCDIVGPLPDGLWIAYRTGTATVKEIREMFGEPAGEAARTLFDSLDGHPYALTGEHYGPFTWEEGKVRFCVEAEHGQYVLRMDAMGAPGQHVLRMDAMEAPV